MDTWKAQVYERFGDWAEILDLLGPVVDSADDAEALALAAQAGFQLGHASAALALIERLYALEPSAGTALSAALIALCAPDLSEWDLAGLRIRYATHLKPPSSPASRIPSPDGRLRIGYLSAHWHQPSYLPPVYAALANHDRRGYAITVLDDAGAGRPDVLTTADRYIDTSRLADDSFVSLLAGLDVLVDLSGYSSDRRHGVLQSASLPVPTVGWFNHFAPSGLAGMTAAIGDDCAFDGAHTRAYTEGLHRVGVSYLRCGRVRSAPPPEGPDAGEPPRFGSLASSYKITDAVLDVWATILRRSDRAELLLSNPTLGREGNRRWIEGRFADRGVDPARLRLLGGAAHPEFIGRYRHVDIVLDPWPYSGGTTSTEALWQGASIVTLAQERWGARTTASLVTAAGQPEAVCGTVDEYVERSLGLADDVGRLRRDRADRHRSVVGSAMTDAAGLAADLEVVYEVVAER